MGLDICTREKILNAIVRIEAGRPRFVDQGRKLSILAVAEEAKISPSTIHNRYADLAEIIRAKLKKGTKEQLHLTKKRLRNKADIENGLRDRLKTAEAALALSRSVALTQSFEIDSLLRRIKELESGSGSTVQ